MHCNTGHLRSRPQTSLSCSLCQAVGPPLRARAEARLPHRLQRHTLLHAEASSFSETSTAPSRRWEIQDARGSSPWNPSWSPGCTRSFYSNRNGCRHPWRLRGPGSPWQPSGSDRLEPSCTGQRGHRARQVWEERKAPPHKATCTEVVCSAIPRPGKGRQGACGQVLF